MSAASLVGLGFGFGSTPSSIVGMGFGGFDAVATVPRANPVTLGFGTQDPNFLCLLGFAVGPREPIAVSAGVLSSRRAAQRLPRRADAPMPRRRRD